MRIHLDMRMLRTAIEAGANFVDTAYGYHDGRSEVVLEQALRVGIGSGSSWRPSPPPGRSRSVVCKNLIFVSQLDDCELFSADVRRKSVPYLHCGSAPPAPPHFIIGTCPSAPVILTPAGAEDFGGPPPTCKQWPNAAVRRPRMGGVRNPRFFENREEAWGHMGGGMRQNRRVPDATSADFTVGAQ
jgi:hypothetical protein